MMMMNDDDDDDDEDDDDDDGNYNDNVRDPHSLFCETPPPVRRASGDQERLGWWGLEM